MQKKNAMQAPSIFVLICLGPKSEEERAKEKTEMKKRKEKKRK